MKITLKSLPGNLRFEASNEKGDTHLFSGEDQWVRPMESVLMAMAACSSIDVELFLKKMRQDIQSIEVEATAERAEEPPRIFTKINLIYKLTGDIKDEKAQKAIEMSINTYCSVSKMIEKSAEISYSYQ